MAVVTKYGTGYPDPTSKVEVDADFAEAHVKSIVSQIGITNGDSINSKYYVGRVPSNAIIDPSSVYTNAAITGVTSFDLGFVGAVNALVAAVSLAVASTAPVNATVAVTAANQVKRAWQLAGLTSDPGGFLDIFATINAAATATGVVNFFLKFLRKI
jgi:hypothetical protein